MARSRDARDDRDMVDVVLENEADAYGPGEQDGRGHADQDRSGAVVLGARHRRGAVLGVVLVLGAIAIGVVTADQHQAVRRERWAHLPSVALPVDEPVRELWRVRTGSTTGRLLDHDLYLAVGRDGVLRATDAATGAQRWSAALPGSGTPTTERCVAPKSEPPTVVCSAQGPGDGADLVVLDAASGQEVARHPLPAPPSVLVADTSAVVLAFPTAGRGASVRSIDPVSGVVRWEHRVSPPPDGASDAFDLDLAPGIFWRVTDGALFAVGDLDLAVLLSTGRVLPWAQEMARVTTNVEGLVGGAWATGPGIPTGEVGRVLEAYGSLRFTFDGAPLDLLVDDGSEPDVLLVRSWPRLTALDARTGAVRWTVGGPCGEGRPVMRLAGSLICALESDGEGVVTRFDIATGDEVWRRGVGPAARISLATDGDRVIVPGAGEGRHDVQSYAWSDGESGWTSSLPDDVQTLFVADRRLYGSGDRVIVRLG